MQETLDETNFVIQAALQIVQGNSHDVKGENEESGIKAMPSYLSRSRALAMTASAMRSEEHTSELQSLMRISSAVFCLKKNTQLRRPYKINNSSKKTQKR